jgi:acetyl esterase/lipase
VPYLNRRAYPSLSRHYPADALSKDPYFSPAVAGTFAYLADAQAQPRGLRIFVQHGTVELLTPDQELFVKKLRDEGVQVRASFNRVRYARMLIAAAG